MKKDNGVPGFPVPSFRRLFHGEPRTRRDFLSSGLIAYSATTFLPSLAGLYSKALAEDCGSGTNENSIPFLVFDCAGGAALPGNFLVGGKGGPKDFLKTYDLLGWQNHPKDSGAIDERFGLPMSLKESKIFQGISQTATAQAQAGLRMGSFCHFADSDSGNNKLSAISLVLRSGYKGSMVSSGLGTLDTLSGGRSEAAFTAPEFKALFVKKIETLADVIDIRTSEPFKSLSKKAVASLFDKINRLSIENLLAFEESESAKELKKNFGCASKANGSNQNGGVSIDPRNDPQFQNIYGINTGTASDTQAAVFATLTRSVLNGISGPAALTFGDCDYHNNTSTLGDTKDLEIGQYIGRAVQAAFVLKKPLFFQLLTDGGCSNTRGTRIWTSDANEKCMTVIGYFNPATPPKLTRPQIGFYTNGQGAALEDIGGIGKQVEKVAAAVFANYLRVNAPGLSGTELYAQFQKHARPNPFKDETEFRSHLVFEV